MKPILDVEGIAKKYRIEHLVGGYLSLRERMLKSIRFEKSTVEDFWALKDISFSLNAGESMGIIGRNGAGKSTLLKILSKITPPTAGRIITRGRIASLLEVGTGFHPELTGRENIFFNGSLLGMKRDEIEKKFEEIVDFSGTEEFLDTPLKHFSSGMQLRLAFSVAAFLDPEILIIDEVLAVGDAEFQKKCLGKMEDVSKSGRTILFVSHDLNAVKSLCSKCILLDKGKIIRTGETNDVVAAYISGGDNLGIKKTRIEEHKLNDTVSLRSFSVNNTDPEVFSRLDVSMTVKSKTINAVSGLSFLFFNAFQERVAIVDLRSAELIAVSKVKAEVNVRVAIDDLPLIEGDYYIGLYIESNLCTGNFLDIVKISVHRRSDRKIEPYPVQVRGKMEFKNEFIID